MNRSKQIGDILDSIFREDDKRAGEKAVAGEKTKEANGDTVETLKVFGQRCAICTAQSADAMAQMLDFIGNPDSNGDVQSWDWPECDEHHSHFEGDVIALGVMALVARRIANDMREGIGAAGKGQRVRTLTLSDPLTEKFFVRGTGETGKILPPGGWHTVAVMAEGMRNSLEVIESYARAMEKFMDEVNREFEDKGGGGEVS